MLQKILGEDMCYEKSLTMETGLFSFLMHRVCWLLILLVMMGVSIEQLYKRLDTFLLAVNIEIEHEQ